MVEVADSSLYFDLTKKAGLYARAGIPEYWVANVNGRRFYVLREPRDGEYQSVTENAAHETVSPMAAPDAKFLVGLAFPSAE